MRLRPLAVAAMAVVALVGCSPAAPTAPVTPTPTASVSPVPPTTTPASPDPADSLPSEFPVDGSIAENAERIVAELHRVSGGRPALKLDITSEQVTLTVVEGENSQRSFRWREGVVGVADSDVQNLGQATFLPTAWPLHDLPRILDVAGLLAGSATNQILQVVEYRAGEVYLTVTTRPETRTIFFHRDGTAVPPLSTHGVADIEAGFAEVTSSAQVVLAVGFSEEQGFWADVPRTGGVIERRTRKGTLPMFVSQRQQTLGLTPFDPGLLEASAIAMAMSAFREQPEDSCAVEIDDRFERVQPVIRYDCAGSIHYTDMQGRDMTGQFTD